MSRKTYQGGISGLPYGLVVSVVVMCLAIGLTAAADEEFQGGFPCEQGPFPECFGDCPPGERCLPGSNVCFCEPLPCDQSFPVCDGDCPPGEVCRDDGTGGGCICGPEPCEAGIYPDCNGECPPESFCALDDANEACYCQLLSCENLPYPQCQGECPPGTVCIPGAAAPVCLCDPVSNECSQCAAGAHFVDLCGPFPPVGTDLVADSSAIVGIDVDFDCVEDMSLVLLPCPAPNHQTHIDKVLGPIDDSVHFPGTSPVDGHPTGPGLDVIDTEMFSLCLTGSGITLVAGVGGPSAIPLSRSLGTVAELAPDPFLAESFFDVFFEVEGIPGGPAYNQAPLRVSSVIDCLPPAARYHHPVGICLPLYSALICNGGPNQGMPCQGDADCDPGACEGGVLLANLVNAIHSINQPVCGEVPFPDCVGDCPPGEVCMTDTLNDACVCVPLPCEQSPFPLCAGECPVGDRCVAGVDSCYCEPVPCEQSPAPECLGECPPNQACFETEGGDCECQLLACEQTWPECGGECPPGTVCRDIGGACACEPLQCSETFPPVCDGECPPGKHCEEVTAGADLPSPDLPPDSDPSECEQILSLYSGVDQRAIFPGGIDLSDPLHECFRNVERQDDGQGNEIERFDSVMEGMIDVGSGPAPVTLTGPVEVITYGKTDQTTGTFDAEIVSMSLTGTAGGLPVEIRESPTLVSPGRTDITDLGGGLYHIDSFFDVFTELSVDGDTFEPQINEPVRMELVPIGGGQCECVEDVLPCDQTWPDCGGECPVGETCVPDPTLDECVCQPLPCEQTWPGCGGECPPGTFCAQNSATLECTCEPLPCEQTYPECSGDCPPGTYCKEDPDNAACYCELLPCDVSPYPLCAGECPDGTACEPLTTDEACYCNPQPNECSQCGPGDHFVDNCGPFPPVGTDLVADDGARVSIDLDLDCVPDMDLVLLPCPAPDHQLHIDKVAGPLDDSIFYPGTRPIDGHLDVIDTEMISLCLTDAGVTLVAGANGPSAIPLNQTLGYVAERPSDPAHAKSIFDVFFEVSGIPGGPAYNQVPLRKTSIVDCLPPATRYYHAEDICLPLHTAGTCNGGVNDGLPCVNDGDCPPDGTCAGGTVLANLISAIHSPNQPVCGELPFPECTGDCPPGETCITDTGLEACDCVPLPCGQSEFPICAGECPPSEQCVAGEDACLCEILPCEQTFPQCDGECPAGEICVEDPTGQGCVCGLPPCEASPYPQCAGECPDGTACEPLTTDEACYCNPQPNECSQCGPGDHFVDNCGPFPPVGTDLVADDGARVSIDLDLDCAPDMDLVLLPCPAPDHQLHVDKVAGPLDDSFFYPGTRPIDGHLDVIDTEMISLCLTDAGITLVAGAGGPSAFPLDQTLGNVAEKPSDPAYAQSFFDVFFEVSGIPGGPAYNRDPLRKVSSIDCLPPASRYYHAEDICLPLYTTGLCNGGVNDGLACINDGDCPPDGTCAGGVVLVNLISAIHTPNRPVCGEGPFPECIGDCPPGTTCVIDTPNEACVCVPVDCGQSEYPICAGECPPNEDCVAGVDTCFCELLPCDQTWPECGGECPPDTHCEEVATPGADLPSADLPPESDPDDCDLIVSQYAGQDLHATFPGGIEFSNPIHKCFQNVQREPIGQDEMETFDSTVEGMVDLGSGPVPATLTGPVQIITYGRQLSTSGLFDTEIVSMSLSGDAGGVPILVREDVALSSTGQTKITDLGGGLYHIDSFFDVFTELSVDGGESWRAQENGPGRMELVPTGGGHCECVPDIVACEDSWPGCGGECPPGTTCRDVGGLCACEPLHCEETAPPTCDGECPPDTHCEEVVTPGADLPSADLPPESDPAECERVVSQYAGQDLHARFPGGIVFSDPLHKCYQNVQREDIGEDEMETFDSMVEGMLDLGAGPVPVTLTGPIQVITYGRLLSTTGLFDTEIVSMSMSGDVGGVPVAIRESPTLTSPGQTDITDLGGGLYHIDSFFDVFTELSVDGGDSWLPQENGPGRMELVPTGAGHCECVPDGVACENSWPECGGECPPGEICGEDATGQGCVCRPAPVCEDTLFPECDGICPQGTHCVNVVGTDHCECVPDEPECESMTAPMCNGSCPPDWRCVDHVDFCQCEPCDVVVPGPVDGVHFLDKHWMRWAVQPCAIVYNVYEQTAIRMADSDGDGLADSYGSCMVPDLVIPEIVTAYVPPLGFVSFMQVTAENSVGEGSMGFNSQLMPRPNVTPCP